jgi:AAHS family 4-hydroxybenzoate transporter-like MFS transporter
MNQTEETSMPLHSRLEHAPLRPVHWMVIALLGLAILFDGYDMQATAFIAPALRDEWNLAAASLGPVLSAALIGMAVGTWLGGSAGDRWGRRSTLIGSVVIFGGFALSCGLAQNPDQLALLRFVTGVGLGAAVPNATALISEWSPLKYRSYAVTFIIVAVPIGGMLGAALSSWIVPEFGWRIALMVGGALPLVLALAMAAWLPESPAFVLRRRGAQDAARLLDRHAIPALSQAATPATGTSDQNALSTSHITPLSPEFRRATAGLWLAFLASMYVLYSYLSWLPVLLSMNGVEMAKAIRGSLYFNLFGVAGSFLGAWAMARSGSRNILVFAGVMALLATVAIAAAVSGDAARTYALTMIAVALIGASVLTIQVTLYALAARIYPPECRARGIGWAASIGRLGAITSAAIGGTLLESQQGPSPYFITIGLALALLLAGTLIVDRHIPRTARPNRPGLGAQA